MQEPQDVQEWLQVHRALLEREAAFTDLAIRAVDGQVSPEELDEQRKSLMALRALCTAVYEKAFARQD